MKIFSKRIVALLMSLIIAAGMFVTASASEVVYGDLNKDSKINSIDALIILRHNVRLELVPDELAIAADVNGDTKINSLDALEVLMVAVKQLPYFSAEIKVKLPKTDNEILALYASTIKAAREKIPAYKLATESYATDVQLSGTLASMLPAEEVEAMKQDMLKKQVSSNIYRQGTTPAKNNLPIECKLTDASVLKSLTCERLPSGEYSVVIKFKDELNPASNTPVVTVFGLPDYATMEKNLKDEMSSSMGEEDISATVTVGDMEYSDAVISFVIDPRTGNLVSMDMSVDMTVESKTAIAFLTLNTKSTLHTGMSYTSFIY